MKTFKDYLLETTMTLPLAKEVLGLTGAYTADDVKKAYQTASNKHHPDKGGDVEMMKKVNVAYRMLKKTSGTGTSSVGDHNKFWADIGEKYTKIATYVDKDLKSKFNPKVYTDYFEKTFGQKFKATVDYYDFSKSPNPSNAGFTAEFKTDDGKIAFDLRVYVYLINVEPNTKGLSNDANISYPLGVTAYGYANMKKQKMAQRDWDSKTNHSVFTDPTIIYPVAKLKKMLVASDKKMTKADFLLGLDKEVETTPWNQTEHVYLVNLTDGFAMINRTVFNRQPFWVVSAIGTKEGKYKFTTNIRMTKYLDETKETLDAFKKLNGLNQVRAEEFLKAIELK